MTPNGPLPSPESKGLRDGVRRIRLPALAGLLLAVLILTLVTPLVARRDPPVPQPISFNHLKHAGELQLGCDFCHQYYRTGAHSGLPGPDTCSICHSGVQGDAEEAARLTQLLQAGDPLQFNKLFRLRPDVFYTHRRHVAIAELECATCHGEIAATERPPERPLVKIQMAFCIDCHVTSGVTTDCTACHR